MLDVFFSMVTKVIRFYEKLSCQHHLLDSKFLPGGATEVFTCAHKSGHGRRDNGTTVYEPRTEERVSGSTKVKMTEDNGVYYVPVEVNGLNLKFIFDTGASAISISSAEVAVMYRQGFISQEDVLGTSQMMDANGDITEGTVVNLRTVKIGDLTLHNIQASVEDNMQAPLLFGQSALSKFGKVSIDYDKGYIEFN